MPHYTYFIGCSDRGREALIEDQHYPDDFNGIVAGAPAVILSPLNYFKHSWNLQVRSVNLDASGKSILTVDNLTVLNNAVMKERYSLDGTVDVLLLNPRACTFDSVTLKRPNDVDSANCLTKAPVIAVKKIYSGLIDDQGNFNYPCHIH